MAIEYVIGIDLGTTNTCVAIVDHGTPTVIAHKGGYRTTPSMLAISEGGRRLVGHLAKRQRETNRAHTVYGAKRLLGRKWGSEAAERTRAMVPYTLVEGPHGDIRLGIRDIVFSAAEVSALILQEVRLLAEGYVGVPIARAVITVPAYFNDNQRQATKDAGRIAGLDVLRIINEPTAAALAYGFGKELRRRVAVYDLGGGTFDFSILEIGDQVFEVLATAGDTFLGGQDFDERVVEYLVSTVEEEAGSGLRADRIAIQRLRDAAERARCELSERDQVTLDLPFLHTTDDGTVHHLRQETLTRAQIESLTEDLVQRTITICDQALSDASLPVDAIEDVILVGGMTRMPRIRQRVAEFFGREPCTGINPDELVALGAAIQGTALLQPTSELILFDVTPQSLGVMIAGGYCHRLIDRNTTIPTKTGHVFTTYRDDQTSVKIVVLQGESDLATDNELLGLFILDGIRRAPRGEVQIDVTFAISVDGTVHVSAKDLDSGYEQTITVTASHSLPDDELARLADESSAYMIEARASEELSRRRRRAERLMTAISETLPQIREVMTGSRFGRETLEKIEGILHRGERELHLGDPHTLLAVTESLERASSMLLGIAERSRY